MNTEWSLKGRNLFLAASTNRISHMPDLISLSLSC